MNKEDVCLAMIAGKCSDEDFLRAIRSAAPYVSAMVIVVAPHDPLLKFRFDDGEGYLDVLPKITIDWHTHDWDGYAPARNRALAEAEILRPWVLTLDTGDTIQEGSELPDEFGNEVAFRIPVRIKDTTILRPHLTRSSEKLRFVGRVHECLPIVNLRMQPIARKMLYVSQLGKQDRVSLLEHIRLLQLDAQENINPTRTLFYLGRTYEQLQEYGPALTAYSARLRLSPEPNEELFWTMLGIARSMAHLKMPYATVIEAYKMTMQTFPHRAEVVRELSTIYFDMAVGLREVANRMKVPQDLELWVESSAYGPQPTVTARDLGPRMPLIIEPGHSKKPS